LDKLVNITVEYTHYYFEKNRTKRSEDLDFREPIDDKVVKDGPVYKDPPVVRLVKQAI